MTILSRRLFLRGAGGFAFASTTGVGSYAFGVEPMLRLVVTTYHLTPPHWPSDLVLRAAIVFDIHACEPWMSAARVREIADVTNSLRPDITLILGDFNGAVRWAKPVMPEQWAEALSVLSAPLGVYSILGNHDWWHGALPRMRGDEAESVRVGLRQAGIALLENDVVPIFKDGRKFWLAGLADQIAINTGGWTFRGLDDLGGTIAKVSDDAPILLLAHEPFIFRHVPDRVSLTLSGHTHGGQVNLPIITSRVTAARFPTHYVYGHMVENGRHIIVSGGLGTSFVPVRFMRPPEIVEVVLGGTPPAIADLRL